MHGAELRKVFNRAKSMHLIPAETKLYLNRSYKEEHVLGTYNDGTKHIHCVTEISISRREQLSTLFHEMGHARSYAVAYGGSVDAKKVPVEKERSAINRVLSKTLPSRVNRVVKTGAYDYHNVDDEVLADYLGAQIATTMKHTKAAEDLHDKNQLMWLGHSPKTQALIRERLPLVPLIGAKKPRKTPKKSSRKPSGWRKGPRGGMYRIVNGKKVYKKD